MIQNRQKSKEKVNKTAFLLVATRDCLKLDKMKINFSKYPIFASSYKQINLNVQLMNYFTQAQHKHFHLLKIKTNNHNAFEQPIFTVKVVQNAQEVNDLQIPMKCEDQITVFVRVTIPQLEISTDINGSLILQVDNLQPLSIPIISRGQVPQIICLKQMLNTATGQKMVKIPSKKQMKIPFKNCSNINFYFEVKLIGKEMDKMDDGVKLRAIPSNKQAMSKFEEQKNKGKDLILHVDANQTFCVTLDFQLSKDSTIKVARRILILQVQGTKLFFPFPLEVIISD